MVLPFTFIAAMRRAMRRHQNVSERASPVPMGRLIAGEVAWGLRQLTTDPPVLAALVGGFIATIAVLSSAAPGPILSIPWRVLAAVAVGLLLAAAVRGLEETRATPESATAGDNHRPLLGATVVSAAATVLVLLAWIIIWLVLLLT